MLYDQYVVIDSRGDRLPELYGPFESKDEALEYLVEWHLVDDENVLVLGLTPPSP